ncbi:type III-B CRISPR-associated protein Cas10/Cmr2 [filamentous cyanobacterium CCT1]|nr:type III-B CRISPR-associated protein Cas10/Cmr2 [filamentous cyanobacterium CCT1]PSN79795.1 type III-B CRISPR-associated protein Cas10/Cmr2 [filamentous cyanobacterium CCP4]
MQQAMLNGESVPEAVRSYVEQARQLDQLNYPQSLDELTKLPETHPQLWQSRIGLVYGGATKIKQYVFEASKLQDIRGASALLDRINLVDLPAFFHGEDSDRFPQCQRDYSQQVRDRSLGTADDSPGLAQALIPELIVYSTGGNILAFCPSAYVHQLANAIEKRYTSETLTANSCAVGETFRFLELRFGLLKDPIEQTNWLEWYQQNASEHLVEAYYGKPGPDLAVQFEQRHSFNQLVGKLSNRFSQRRSGHNWPAENRPSRRYPPVYETHPYVRRDAGEKRSAVRQVSLPGEPWFSDALARKRIVGQKAKRDRQSTNWYKPREWINWEPGEFQSWVSRFEQYLEDHPDSEYKKHPHFYDLEEAHREARSLREVGNASKGFVAYIYADGNNMGGYIQRIARADDYQRFSKNVSDATEECVYRALEKHLKPHQLSGIDDGETQGRDGKWIHPFEILTIGGDDVMLVVPADRALAIAKTISEEFERILLDLDGSFRLPPQGSQPQPGIHRYLPAQAEASQCQLSMSVGVLITADDTPIYYAENLTNQLLKSAKKKAKSLKDTLHYHGGTIDFLVMKSVTMLSSKVEEFRESGLVIDGKPKLKLYGAPYTLHEIGGLLKTAEALKDADFPRSQLYQIRSLLERGKHTAMLNYRYFRVRLAKDKQDLLEENFETAWCLPKDDQNGGNLAPWMSLKDDSGTTYETIWRELIDLYPFIDEPDQTSASTTQATQEVR